jgi:hypothetical protein
MLVQENDRDIGPPGELRGRCDIAAGVEGYLRLGQFALEGIERR